MSCKSLAVCLYVRFVFVLYCLCFHLLNYFLTCGIIISVALIVCYGKSFPFPAKQFSTVKNELQHEIGLFTTTFLASNSFSVLSMKDSIAFAIKLK